MWAVEAEWLTRHLLLPASPRFALAFPPRSWKIGDLVVGLMGGRVSLLASWTVEEILELRGQLDWRGFEGYQSWDAAGRPEQRQLEVEAIWAKGFVLLVQWEGGRSLADWKLPQPQTEPPALEVVRFHQSWFRHLLQPRRLLWPPVISSRPLSAFSAWPASKLFSFFPSSLLRWVRRFCRGVCGPYLEVLPWQRLEYGQQLVRLLT